MSKCSECASLCCIAPSISEPDEYQGKLSGIVIKTINTRCENLCNNSGCGIYDSRGYNREACKEFDCKGFGPVLTQYLRETNGFTKDGILTEDGMRIYILLNGMLCNTFYGSNDRDLFDAIDSYSRNKKWPEWMLTDDYYNFLFKPRLVGAINPRFNKKISLKISLFKLAFPLFYL